MSTMTEEKKRERMVLFLNNATKLALREDNTLVMISPDWETEVEIGYCTLTDPKSLQETLQAFSSRIA